MSPLRTWWRAAADFNVIGRVREAAEEEDLLTPPSLTFFTHALPALPVLALGFLFMEWREIVSGLEQAC